MFKLKAYQRCQPLGSYIIAVLISPTMTLFKNVKSEKLFTVKYSVNSSLLKLLAVFAYVSTEVFPRFLYTECHVKVYVFFSRAFCDFPPSFFKQFIAFCHSLHLPGSQPDLNAPRQQTTESGLNQGGPAKIQALGGVVFTTFSMNSFIHLFISFLLTARMFGMWQWMNTQSVSTLFKFRDSIIKVQISKRSACV